jgi:hypothetical protein
MFLSVLRFDASYRRRRSFPPPTNTNQAVVKGIIEDLQLLALSQPHQMHRIARIVRGVVLHLNLRQPQQQRH